MEFTLYLKTQVDSNDNAEGKHVIRQKFHKQLKLLWDLPPWKTKGSWKMPIAGNALYINKSGKHFICLATKEMDMYVELDIKFYVPTNTSFKDIDNKLKTICDALRLPQRDFIEKWSQEDYENPFFCLLEDDELIYKISAETDYVLDLVNTDEKLFANRNEMLCLINIIIKGNRLIGDYSDLIV
jgi:hypothetical protein